jgi:long-chain fatty acid transport protein
MKWVMTRVAVRGALGFVLAAAHATAGGFLIYEHGARATALAGTLAARGGDLSVMVYNPAALASLRGTHFSIGTTLIFPTATFAGANPYPGFGVTEDYKDRVLFPSNLYVGHQLGENLAAGLAIFNPYGLVVDWVNPESFSGRYISYKSMLRSFYFNPTIAYKLSPELSVGAGLQAVYADVELNRINGTTVNGRLYDTAKIKLEGGSNVHWGFNGGLRFEATDKIRIGVAYRSEVEIEFDDGEATFTQIPINASIDPVVAASLPKKQKATTSTTLPAILSLGVDYQATGKLDVAFDAVLTGWSSFHKLVINFPDSPELTSVTPENWADVWSYRFGAQYQWNDRLALRAGYIRDFTPQPKASMSPLLPDANRHDFSFGFGYKLNDSLTLDLANMLVFFDERSTDGLSHDSFNGEYRVFAYLVGVNFTYSF